MTTASPFDAEAAAYDAQFTATPTGQWLRQQVWDDLGTYFAAGDHVLELGCGTGEDACWLAGRGVQVTATDASPAMLAQTRRKAQAHDLSGHITTARLDLNALDEAAFARQYDGAFSNFGPLNCTLDWAGFAQWLAARLRPGGLAAFAVMPPFCLWETVWHGLHLNFRTATRRWSGQAVTTLAGGQRLTVYYPTPRRLARDFAPYFERVSVRGLGVCLPPSDLFGGLASRPRLERALVALEKRLAQRWPFYWLGDHYWITFRRR